MKVGLTVIFGLQLVIIVNILLLRHELSQEADMMWHYHQRQTCLILAIHAIEHPTLLPEECTPEDEQLRGLAK